MGHSQFLPTASQGQSPNPLPGHPCSCRCLLKGCERWFLPHHFHDCYCSPECRQAARRWRRWHAARRYRVTANGKQGRREQAQRHRDRKRLRPALTEPVLLTPETEPVSSTVEADVPPLTDPPTAVNSLRVGQRQPKFPRIPGSGPAAGRAATSFSAYPRDPPSGDAVLAPAGGLYDASGSGRHDFESAIAVATQDDGPVITLRPGPARYIVTY